MSDSDDSVSRWTRRRRLRNAYEAGREDGGSDLSSSGDSSQEPEPQRRRVEEAGSSAGSAAGSIAGSAADSNDGNNEEAEEETEEGTDSDEEMQGVAGDVEGVQGLEGNEGVEEIAREAAEDEAHHDNLVQNQEDDELEDPESSEEEDEENSSGSDSESETDEDDDEASDEDEASDGDSEHDDNDRGELDGDGPLYNDARITWMESIMMILTFALTFSLSGQCLAQLLVLIEKHCPAVNRCTTTLYKFKKIFSDIGRSVLVLHYYCERCYKYLPRKDSVCENCDVATNVAFFIEVPILNQLQRMFLRPGFVESLAYRFNRQKQHADNLEDIYDGRLYKELSTGNGILAGLFNLSFMWYTDGISIFKSSKFSVWPLFFVINELSYKSRTRKENIVLAGLWFGKKKPRPNLFMRPFRNFFKTFRQDGFELRVPQGQPVNVKGVILCGTCDLQAKSVFMCMKQSNGYYGCSKCNSEGLRVPAGRTTVQVHRYIPPEQMSLRIERNIPAYARSKQLGHKALPSLYLLMPSMLRGMGIDVMHMVFIGISKLFTKLWFDPAFAGEPYSCYRMIDVLNEKLQSIKPPSFVQRFTRNLSDLKLWKAKEHKLWFFYYAPIVMKGVLENVYLQHYLKLVSGISLLSQGSIFPEQIDAADVLLNEFVAEFQALYTVRFMGMNIHLLLHVADVVRDLGPLWVFSCFFLEDLNGQLAKLIHGPNQVGLQICSSASLFLSLRTLIGKLDPMSIAKNFCENLTSQESHHKIAEFISEKMKIVGRSAFSNEVSRQTKQIIRDQHNLDGGHFQKFFLLRKSGVVMTSEAKVTNTKRCSMYVLSHLEDDTPILGKVLEYVRFSPCDCNTICLCLPAQYFAIVQKYDRIRWHAFDVRNIRIAYLNAVQSTEEVFAVPCKNIKSVCFYINCDGIEYLGIPVNNLEYE